MAANDSVSHTFQSMSRTGSLEHLQSLAAAPPCDRGGSQAHGRRKDSAQESGELSEAAGCGEEGTKQAVRGTQSRCSSSLQTIALHQGMHSSIRMSL